MVRRSRRGIVAVLAVLVAASIGCGARNLVPDGGGGGGPAGSSGGGSPATDANLGNIEVLSDFQSQVGRINMAGTPPRSGYWYAYNDGSATCAQQPTPSGLYDPGVPPSQSPGPSGGFALHAIWRGCNVWGAGIGAYLNVSPPSDDGGGGTSLPYDLTGYQGVTFWAMAKSGTSGKLRFKAVMRAETLIRDGGGCDEAVVGINKCGDSWGQTFTMPTTGTWQQVVVLFSDASKFKQEFWGALFPWNPADVTAIQIQSQGTEIDLPYDFWIDDVYLIK